MIKRLQNKIAESRFALPVTALYTFLVWIAAGLHSDKLWIQFACMVLSTYLMVELNNRNALMRIYSRMVSCSFMVLMGTATMLFPSIEVGAVSLCFISFYLLYFYAYQEKALPGIVFYAFAVIGIASIFFVQILYYVPVLWIILATNILAFSARNFFSSIFGLIAPYWFLGGYYAYKQDLQGFLNHFIELANFQPLFDYSQISNHYIATYFFIMLLAIIGSLHFLRNSFMDKIRTRMLYDVFIIMLWLSLAMLAVQPQHDLLLFPVAVICVSPLVGHFLALTGTRWTNIAFFVVTALTLLLTIYNIWMLS